jgi:iron uptake system component EfeO
MRKFVVAFAVGLVAVGCAQSADSGNGRRTQVEADDFSFEPSTLRVDPGRHTFVVRNVGKEIHEFEIFEGKKLVDEVEDISPGLTRELTVSLAKGTYEFACKFEDHYERGMKGSLRVG